MTDFEHDFAEEAAIEAAAEQAAERMLADTEAAISEVAGEPVAVVIATEETPIEDDFFAENAAPAIPQVDPAKIVTIIPSSSDNRYVETDGNPVPMLDLISRAELRFEGDFTCYLNNAEISLTTLVPAGSTVSIVGKVKGG